MSGGTEMVKVSFGFCMFAFLCCYLVADSGTFYFASVSDGDDVCVVLYGCVCVCVYVYERNYVWQCTVYGIGGLLWSLENRLQTQMHCVYK